MLIKPETLFDHDTPNVYTMPSGAAFLTELAKGLKAALGNDLASAMILLPTRRAVRGLTEAFLALENSGAVLLPLMRPLADLDENEPPFSLASVDLDIAPAIDTVRHRFELAQLVARKMTASGETEAPDAASVLAMSEPIVSLLNDISREELDMNVFDRLDDDIENMPAHFQSAAEFVKIIATYWPQYLADLGLSEPKAHEVALLNAAAEIWEKTPPQNPVIVAGSTGTFLATSRLIKSISKMPKGLVILPGLDQNIDDVVWKGIDDQHPQASLKNLVSRLELRRADIPEWPDISLSHKAKMRARIVSESLIPADATSDWPERIARVQASVSDGNPIADGLVGLSLVEAKTEDEEASIVALILRETLQVEGKTAALITPDPALARRVRAKLSRWGLELDSSAGEPLEETSHGSFLALSMALALDPFDPVALSGLIGHKLFAPDILLKHSSQLHWEALEKHSLRGTRVQSVAALETRLNGDCPEGLKLFIAVQNWLSPLHTLSGETRQAGVFATEHTKLIETLCGGAENIWRGEAGEKAASLMEELMEYGGLLPEVDGAAYMRLLSMMMRGRVVRPRYGTETRLHILGPLEARMIDADVFVLGGLNEGIWPATPSPHPILSRGMRLKIGLTAPERRFGLAAHDFAQLAAKPNVILTRSQNTNDGPGVQSRWLWRLTTFVKGAGEAEALKGAEKYLHWARMLDKAPDITKPFGRPEPRPALSARWPENRGGRKLSVTQISTFVRDPYAIYARHVLGLRGLDPLDQSIGGREYGIAIHKALENIDTSTRPVLLETLKFELKKAGYVDHNFARMNPRLEAMVDWVMAWAEDRKAQGWSLLATEEKDILDIALSNGNFQLTGIPDRIEKSADGIAIIDYKTGTLPSKKIVNAGFDPQLPLLSMMLYFGKLGKSSVKHQGDCAAELLYIKPNGGGKISKINKTKDEAEELAHKSFEDLKNLIAHFDNEDSAYYSQPRSQYTNPYGDYDHLARRAEWAKLEDGGET